MKKIVKQHNAFNETLSVGLKELGTQYHPYKMYPYALNTKAGILRIALDNNPTSEVLSLFCRFEDVPKTVKIVSCNPYSGKWNFHFLAKEYDAVDIAQIILDHIKSLL